MEDSIYHSGVFKKNDIFDHSNIFDSKELTLESILRKTFPFSLLNFEEEIYNKLKIEILDIK